MIDPRLAKTAVSISRNAEPVPDMPSVLNGLLREMQVMARSRPVPGGPRTRRAGRGSR